VPCKVQAIEGYVTDAHWSDYPSVTCMGGITACTVSVKNTQGCTVKVAW